MKEIFISAGDNSGDLHASKLMLELNKIDPEISFVGIGGYKMLEAGLESLIPIEEISITGFWEVAKKYEIFKELIHRCEYILKDRQIKLFLPVDYPGFNLRLAKFSKLNGINVIYYIAPQLWAWGQNRAKNLADSIDKLLVVFPFEVEFFKNFGLNAEFVGHPLLDIDIFQENQNSNKEREKLIAFLPGSRKQELQQHLPIMEKSAEIIQNKYPNFSIEFAKAPAIEADYFEKLITKHASWKICDDSRNLMSRAIAGVVKTGTSTLEAALCGMPFTMIYKTSFFSYTIGKKLVNLPYISLVNILSGKMLVSELIQNNAKPEKIAEEITKLIENKELRLQLKNEFSKIREMLGTSGASKKAAEIIYSSFIEL